MFRRSSLLSAAAVFLTPLAAFALECAWVESPPTLDGRATNPVWERAKAFTAPEENSSIRLLWDREWLYVFAESWRGENETVDLVLRPSEKHAGAFDFFFNVSGEPLLAFLPGKEPPDRGGQLFRKSFRGEARIVRPGKLNVATANTPVWSIEARIPWTDFLAGGGRPAPGETWQVKLGRGAFVPVTFTGPRMNEREPWQNTRLLGSPDGPPKFVAARAWPKLAAASVVTIAPAPDGEWLWFLEQAAGWEQPMKLRRFRASGDGSDAETMLALDHFAYGITFHPRFAENGHVFLGVNGPTSRPPPPRFSRVFRYTVRDGRPDPASRETIIEWPSDGHNGAALAFAKDGTLFVSSGDGTSDSDVDRVGQNPRDIRAKILRIDVDHPANGKRYSVPRDNPFVNDERFAPETWAYGLRNPWRIAYDAESDQLWSGENGQDLWEFARLVKPGLNYGWSLFEGSHPFAQDRPAGPHPVTFPTLEFSHAEFRSLSGGVVYRGKNFPELAGSFVFGDFGTGRIWAAKHDGTNLEWSRELLDTPLAITHVTADAAGELLVTDYGSPVYGAGVSGGIYRIERAPVAAIPPREFPRKLSDTGIFSDTAKLTPLPGVLPYEINVPGWHDGATEAHHLALPAGETLEVRPTKSWQAPDNTVLAQTLTVAGRRIETRVLVKQPNDCAAYTYVWNAEGTDAELGDKGGADLELSNGQPWRVPSRAECIMCHSRQANFALTLHDAQLNVGDQLARWERLGILRSDASAFERDRAARAKRQVPSQASGERTPAASSLLPRHPERLGRFVTADNPNADLEARARSYLGVNCAHCHTMYGGGNSPMEFDWLTPREEMRALNEPPAHGDFGLEQARVIAPGAAARSVIVPRVSTRGPGQMPPVWTRMVDPTGTRLLVEWIQALRE